MPSVCIVMDTRLLLIQALTWLITPPSSQKPSGKLVSETKIL